MISCKQTSTFKKPKYTEIAHEIKYLFFLKKEHLGFICVYLD